MFNTAFEHIPSILSNHCSTSSSSYRLCNFINLLHSRSLSLQPPPPVPTMVQISPVLTPTPFAHFTLKRRKLIRCSSEFFYAIRTPTPPISLQVTSNRKSDSRSAKKRSASKKSKHVRFDHRFL